MPNVRTIVAGALLGSLVLAACGGDDDDSASGSTEEFCSLVATELPDDATDADVLANIEEIAAAAPSEISDEVNEVATAFGTLQAIDLETADEETLAEFEILLARLDELGPDLEAWATENCPDVPPGFFTGG